MGRYLDLLKAKKNENRPPTDATKPTKPPETEQSDSFVGFVAYPSPHFEKNEGEPKPTDTALAVDWHQADRAYQAHHITCPVCIAAGKGYGSRCDEGQRLHDAYEAAPMPEFGKGKRFTPTA